MIPRLERIRSSLLVPRWYMYGFSQFQFSEVSTIAIIIEVV